MNSDSILQRAKAFDYLFDAVVVTDLNGIIIDWNKGSERLYGYSKIEAIGQPVCMLHVPEDTAHITTEVISAVEKDGKWNGEVRMLHKNGSIGWIESMCVPIFDQDHQMIGALGINRDITSRKEEAAKLKYLAHYDQLTQIPNRYLLLDRVNQLVKHAKRYNCCFTLLYIDLDKFKTVNDTKGHSFGDQVLKQSAQRIFKLIRESDTLARIGGDEFVVLLEDTSDKNDIAVVAKSIIRELERTFIVDNEHFEIGCSIGIATYPNDGVCTDSLLSSADNAMYKAKNSGRDSFSFSS